MKRIKIIDDPTEALEYIKASEYTKVAEKLILLWGTEECNEYFKQLLVSDRINREGFPKPIFERILKLYLYHEDRYENFVRLGHTFGVPEAYRP